MLLIPMWIIYLCIPLGAFYFALEMVLSVVERWDKPYGPRGETPAEDSA